MKRCCNGPAASSLASKRSYSDRVLVVDSRRYFSDADARQVVEKMTGGGLEGKATQTASDEGIGGRKSEGLRV